MKRVGLWLAIFLIIAMAVFPLYSFLESIRIGKLPPKITLSNSNTNNTSRIRGKNWQEVQDSVRQMMFPSDQPPFPGLVVFVEANKWTQALAATSLLALPVPTAVQLIDDNSDSAELDRKLQELQPRGNEKLEGKQVLLVGALAKHTSALSQEGWEVLSITDTEPAAAARELARVSEEAGLSPTTAILVDAGQDVRYALPAVTWAAHTGTPIGFVNDGEVPAATRELLQGKTDIYFLGSPRSTGSSLRQELAALGSVKYILNSDYVELAAVFAQYYDPGTRFGWRTTQATREGGKRFLLAPTDQWQYAFIGAQVFSQSIFGPLLLSPDNYVPPALEKLLFYTKPDWWVTPAEGPFNHTWIVGDQLSYAVQGRVNFLQEINSYEDQGDQAVSGLDALSMIWYIWCLVSAIWIWFHLSTRMFQISPFMKISWVLVGLSLGPVALWGYLTAYRGYGKQVAAGAFPRPLWVQVLSATLSTVGFGIPVMVITGFLLTYWGLPLFFLRTPLFGVGSPMGQNVLWSYAAALAANMFLFVPLMLALKENSAYWDTVRHNWLTVFFSMTSISVGMMGVMWWVMKEYFEMKPEESALLWWGAMYFSNIAGLITGYVGNWFLVIRGEKKGTM